MMLPLELSVMVALGLSAAAGLLVSTWVYRSMVLHRRPSLQMVCAVAYIVVVAASAVAVNLEFEPTGFNPLMTDLMLATHTAALGALFPLLREFFAYAVIDFQPGERIEVGSLRGTVAHFSWTGLDIRLEGDDRIESLRPAWLLDQIISRLPD